MSRGGRRVVRPVRVSTKGQVVIPVEVRRSLRIKPGDQIVIVAADGDALLMTAARYAQSVRGMARGLYGKTREDIDAYVRGERRTWQ